MSSRLFLLKELVRRDVKGRYAGSLFGLVWSFAQPLWMLALFGFVFSSIMKVPSNSSLALFPECCRQSRRPDLENDLATPARL